MAMQPSPEFPTAELVLMPGSINCFPGDTVNVDIVAELNWPRSQRILAFQILLRWNPEHLRLIGGSSDYQAMYAGFMDRLSWNKTFSDGTAQYVVIGNPGSDPGLVLQAEREPFIVATLRFRSLKLGKTSIGIDHSDNHGTYVLGTNIGVQFLGWGRDGAIGSVRGATVWTKEVEDQDDSRDVMAVLGLVVGAYRDHLKAENAEPDPVLQLAMDVLEDETAP